MKIVHYPHPALRHPVKPLTALDKEVHLQVGTMLELMYAARGLGLAANQVALPYQVFVANPSGDPTKREQELVCINPVIVERSGSTIEGEEGCLSFPELFQKIRRARTVKLQAYNLKGEQFEVVASDLASRLLQHENDHLQGILYIDKMGPLAKLASRGALKVFERDFRRAQARGEIPSDADLEASLAAGDNFRTPSASAM